MHNQNNQFMDEPAKPHKGLGGKKVRRRNPRWRDQDEDHGSISWSRQVGDPKVDVSAELRVMGAKTA